MGLKMIYFYEMTGKKPRGPGELKRTFAENVRRLMDQKYILSPNKPKSLAMDAGITLSSVQRALGGETSPTLDTVEVIASALDAKPESMLVKKNPPSKRTGTHG